jgi:cob(I)alamin adenosyltransferase
MKMRNIYTRKGDTGTTSLCGGVRVNKDDPAIEVCGTIDELSASLGVVRTERLSPQFDPILLRIQQELIGFCAEIVANSEVIALEHVQQLESDIDRIESELPPLTQFIIPGENRTSAMLHLSRTICRRAERRLTTRCRTENSSPYLLAYLNRLSDLLFVIARKVGGQ